MSFMKRENRHFPVAVVQWRQRNVVFAFSPIAFLTFSLSSPSFWKQKLFSAGLSVRWRIVVFGRRSLWMPRPFQWSTDDDDEVYRVHEIQHCWGTSELSVPRLLTYIVQRKNIKNAFDFNLFGVVHIVTHKRGTKDISHSSLDFLIIANKGKSKVHIIFANLARNKIYCIEN